jgi:hypothetical protein
MTEQVVEARIVDRRAESPLTVFEAIDRFLVTNSNAPFLLEAEPVTGMKQYELFFELDELTDFKEFWNDSAVNVVTYVKEKAVEGLRAVKHNAIILLSWVFGNKDKEIVSYALNAAVELLEDPDDMLFLVYALEKQRGMGRMVKAILSEWYMNQKPEVLLNYVIKNEYEQHSCSHKYILKRLHLNSNDDYQDAVFKAIKQVNFDAKYLPSRFLEYTHQYKNIDAITHTGQMLIDMFITSFGFGWNQLPVHVRQEPFTLNKCFMAGAFTGEELMANLDLLMDLKILNKNTISILAENIREFQYTGDIYGWQIAFVMFKLIQRNIHDGDESLLEPLESELSYYLNYRSKNTRTVVTLRMENPGHVDTIDIAKSAAVAYCYARLCKSNLVLIQDGFQAVDLTGLSWTSFISVYMDLCCKIEKTAAGHLPLYVVSATEYNYDHLIAVSVSESNLNVEEKATLLEGIVSTRNAKFKVAHINTSVYGDGYTAEAALPGNIDFIGFGHHTQRSVKNFLGLHA